MQEKDINTLHVVIDTKSIYEELKVSLLQIGVYQKEVIDAIYKEFIKFAFVIYNSNTLYIINKINSEVGINELESINYSIRKHNFSLQYHDYIPLITQLAISLNFELDRCKLNVNEFGNRRDSENDTYIVNTIDDHYVIVERYTEYD